MPHLFDPSKIVDGKSHTKRHLEKVRTWVSKECQRAKPQKSPARRSCAATRPAPPSTPSSICCLMIQSRMVALPYEAQDVTEEILDHLFPPADVLTAWMNGEDAAWPPPPNDELRFEVGSQRRSAASGRTIGNLGPWWLYGTRRRGFPPGFYAPYQVELDMGNLIFAPDDSDGAREELIAGEEGAGNVSDGA